MNKDKVSHFFSIVFVAIIFVFFVSIISTLFLRHSEANMQNKNIDLSEDIESPESVRPDDTWINKYPFSSEYTFEPSISAETDAENKDEDEDNLKSNYLTTINGLKYKIEYYATDLLVGRMKFVEANAIFNKAIGMKLITGTDSVAVMDNGYLTYEAYETDTENAAKSLIWFQNQLEKKNIDFLYVQCPSKENKFDCRLPNGMTDWNNINADALLSKLSKNNINTLDLRPLLNAEFSDYYSCFFKTDHHWKPETGVWAAGKIANTMNSLFGCQIDTSIGDIENYNIKIYKDYCFGSQGKKVSLTFADPEDISLVTPKATTDFTVSYCQGKAMQGNFTETMINLSVFDEIDYYNISTYSAYSYGIQAIKSMKNNTVKNEERVLVIGDSFSDVVVPYLAMGIEYLDVLDLRCFDGSVMAYIDEFKPDQVIVCYNPSMLTSDVSLNSVYNFQ